VSSGIAVVTIVAGRREHLAHQLLGLRRQSRLADHLVIVRMDQLDVEVKGDPAGRVTVVDLPADPAHTGRLPLAAARNRGIAASGAETVVMLDVDCIPGADLVASYQRAARSVDGLIAGTLRYLGPDGVTGPGWTESGLWENSRPHPARPQVASGGLVRDDRHELAWTTSLALRRESFDRVGGFDERFTGYGGEDTDFAVRAAAAGVGVWWSGDAVAYHQYHATQSPPVQHLDDIIRNASLFEQLHGWFPMRGWLDAFAERELIDFDPDAGVLNLRARS
jgi:N-acetylglucosaminyl-diphospho-decaprenol L-rhamnosyltransferase